MMVGRSTPWSSLTASWDLRAMSSVAPPCVGEYLGHTSPVRCLSVSSNGRFILTGCEDGSCRVWRKDPLGEVRTSLKDTRAQLHAAEDQIQDLSLPPEMRRELATKRSTLKASLVAARAQEGQLVREGHNSAVRTLAGHVGLVSSCAWKDNSNGRTATVLSSSWDQTVRLYEVGFEELM